MPVGEYHPEFLRRAVGSIAEQTCPHWRLLIIVDDANCQAVEAFLEKELRDPRIDRIEVQQRHLAHKLNAGMRQAATEFVALLLGDDMWASNAIQVLTEHLNQFPEVDFFHSSRVFVDEHDQPISSIYYSREYISLDDFVMNPPVKHLLCWRKAKALALGGLDESVLYVGPDDYDFPWSMAEAQAVFKAVRECLYLLRDHRECYRLTTHVLRSQQIRETKRIMRKHGVARSKIRRKISAAKKSYLRQCLYRSSLDRWIKQKLGYDARRGWKQPYRREIAPNLAADASPSVGCEGPSVTTIETIVRR
jgi:glycosyltransferase involved in cell wall biosynthesis